jgi:hypothetical protein
MLFALAVGAFGAAGARAATRYAAPSAQGSGDCSSPTNSCTLGTAVSGSGQGDTVIVAGDEGTYGTASTPLAATIADPAADAPGAIEGAPGQSRPVIYTDANPGLDLFGTSSVAGQLVATSVSDLDIEELASGLPTALRVSGNVDHTVVRSLNGAFQACEPFGLSPPQTEVISNSLCVAHNGNALGEASSGSPQTQSVTLRNDTLYATGLNARGIEYSIGGFGFTVSVAATNVIAHGDDSDVLANQFNGGSASITLDHSNYATVFQGGGATATLAGTGSNQTSAPEFINPAAEDFHEAVGSPTIDAGATDPANSTTDLDGNPRTIGPATDIGAYEFVPAPTCNPLVTATAFGRPLTIQLQCSDPLGAAVAYAIVGAPAHGTLSLAAATGQALYTPAPGYSGPDAFNYGATSIHGTSAVAMASITVGAAPLVAPITALLGPPVLAGVSETAKTWREGNALARLAAKMKKKQKTKTKLPVGTTFSFSLNEQASMSFAFTQQLSGRRVGHECVAQTNKNQHRQACKSTVMAGTLAFIGHAGINKVIFQGRISSSKKLKPGTYTLTVTATNSAGVHSAPVSLRFTIVR